MELAYTSRRPWSRWRAGDAAPDGAEAHDEREYNLWMEDVPDCVPYAESAKCVIKVCAEQLAT